jgi:hypothetical protein
MLILTIKFSTKKIHPEFREKFHFEIWANCDHLNFLTVQILTQKH